MGVADDFLSRTEFLSLLEGNKPLEMGSATFTYFASEDVISCTGRERRQTCDVSLRVVVESVAPMFCVRHD